MPTLPPAGGSADKPRSGDTTPRNIKIPCTARERKNSETLIKMHKQKRCSRRGTEGAATWDPGGEGLVSADTSHASSHAQSRGTERKRGAQLAARRRPTPPGPAFIKDKHANIEKLFLAGLGVSELVNQDSTPHLEKKSYAQ